ncbi:MAG: peptide-methionine (S)-S-oxide reductase MsrA [Leptolyngbya sp. IPPAS B-1204]|uniref:Peptide methionine sulfoxide reductase MsrA n=1 Tax=Leptolyngbya sp. NK1-12 TaxID=2547451 RepID=A0AA96WNN8_9CYAN|nr:peptide-methionine (S)-S-oxide reductase MsrA [Leptolyngbya sp. NK1-12]MBF2046477.1 peptide-methionine (S)-S-oxide reductase MsrA [Elainella sp. C42_A2020_010]RNJ69772.1 MAG: peptide-methionine (S)-S-oxide reductase [Leptolyngbya sp. IPPAS B-1204]WNZ25956.1 peptide-methionine (S)-S-oxide reductase MsrA [Leptolyngbya sp. NK1-12]
MPLRIVLSNSLVRRFSILSLTAAALMYGASHLGAAADVATTATFPNPVTDIATAATMEEQTAVFAGGCFWGMEGVFEHLKGVSEVVTGYAGGSAASARYEQVSAGTTAHAEAVKITYNPSQITYGQLLKVYFAVAHDPTQLNRQGPDTGPQYRSAIFFANDEQKQVAQAYIDQLNQARVFNRPIVTQLSPLDRFYAAEDYHQDFIRRNPRNPYVILHDLPQIVRLQERFPELYQE